MSEGLQGESLADNSLESKPKDQGRWRAEGAEEPQPRGPSRRGKKTFLCRPTRSWEGNGC